METMRRIVAGLFMSVDGVVDGTGGWQYPYFDEELGAAMAAGPRPDALLLGRRTYEGYAALRVENPDAAVLALIDATDTYVVSSKMPAEVQHDSITVLGADPVDDVERIRRSGDGDVLVLGSPTLVRWLLGLGLLDELQLFVLPVVVGAGLRLLDAAAGEGPHPLRLASSRALRSGVLELRYTPAKP